MQSFETFPLKCISIIVDVAGVTPAKDGSPALAHVTGALINGLRTMDSDDMVYVYRQEGELAMGQTVAESVGVLSDWRHDKLNVATALEESLVLVSQYDNTKRGIFYVTDNYKSQNNGLFREVFNINRHSRYDCSFFVYGVGRGYSKTLSDINRSYCNTYTFHHLDDPSELADLFTQDLFAL